MAREGILTWDEIHKQLNDAAEYIKSQVSLEPKIGIILG